VLWTRIWSGAEDDLGRTRNEDRSIVLLLFLQKQNLATAIYLFCLLYDVFYLVLQKQKIGAELHI